MDGGRDDSGKLDQEYLMGCNNRGLVLFLMYRRVFAMTDSTTVENKKKVHENRAMENG